MEEIPKLKIGDLELKLIQGGMGVGVSGANLASAVSNCGGGGTIASVGLGALYNYPGNYAKANEDALREEIKKAREFSNGSGAIGVNVMRALSDFDGLVKVSVEEDVDYIATGAGHPFPIDLPLYTSNNKIKLIPIVSSSRGASLVTKRWHKKFNHLPDAIIVEGPKAGGHLGFVKPEEIEKLKNGDSNFLNKFLYQEIEKTAQKMRSYNNIPVIAAGGIFYGGDIKRALEHGASGVQMATRFVTTEECDADKRFKQAYLNSNERDLIIIDSPVGLPGRAIKNDFLEKRHNFRCSYKCLETCKPLESPYCIASALIHAQRGELSQGFAFAGLNAYRCNEIISVQQLFKKLETEYKDNLRSA
jgi:nitronate monooxygenase